MCNKQEIELRIQASDNLNHVIYEDVAGPGNGRHLYQVVRVENGELKTLCEIQFQKGGRNEEGSTAGVLEGDLLEIVRHRLQSFQQGEFPSREGEMALAHIEEALMWLNKRKEDRKARDVLGKNLK